MPEIPQTELDERARKRLDNASVAMERGNFEYTVEICEELLRATPECLDVRRLCRSAQQKVYASISSKPKRFLKTVIASGIGGFGYLVLGRSPRKCLAIGERALRFNPYATRPLSLIAHAANKLSLFETEAFSLESICDRYPDNVEKLQRYCESLTKVGETEKALIVVERLTKLKPGNARIQELVRSASVAHSIKRGKWSEEKEDFRAKLKNKEESESLERSARIHSETELGEDKIEDLIKEVHRDPQELLNYKLLVRAGIAKQDYEMALEWLEKAFNLPQAATDASLRQLSGELKVNRVEQELFDLKKRRNAAEGDTAEFDQRIHSLESDLKDLQLEETRKLLEQFPNDYSQRMRYGELLFESGQTDEAIKQLQISQRSPSLKQKSLVLLGRCFLAKTLFDLALEQLEQANAALSVMDDAKKEVLYLIAECLEKLDRGEEAIQNYKSIYANDIEYRDVAEKIDAYYSK